ncbi:MAG: hypothetical protein V3U27_04430 [Candidatus Tectomicrobia bacterium]
MRPSVQRLFAGDHLFARHNILRLTPTGDEPPMKCPLQLADEPLSHSLIF